jgi:hypothetical protein
LADTGERLGGQVWPTLIADCAPIDGYSNNALANARLIAAAPDLLAALREVRAHMQGAQRYKDFEILEWVRAVIAKAHEQPMEQEARA